MNVIEIRRALHKIPELGRKEYKTKAFIKEFLKDSKGTLFEAGETGLILVYDFKKSESIAFRCDMDALEINEANDLEYKSIHQGMMHACGHDAHMAMMLSFSKHIEKIEDYSKNIILVFQPSEEEQCGSKDIINSNILQKYNVTEMYGTHIWPSLDEGVVYTKEKGMLASSCEVNITITGKSVHVANYKDGIDTLAASCYFVNKMYGLQKDLPKDELYLLRCGELKTGTARNIVADKATLKITMRYFSDSMFDKLNAILNTCQKETDETFKTTTNIELHNDYRFVYNDEKLIKKLEGLNIKFLNHVFMQAEDFGNYNKYFPTVFFLLGIGYNTKLHSENFTFNEDVLEIGVNNYLNILKIRK